MTTIHKTLNILPNKDASYYVCTCNLDGQIAKSVWVVEEDNAFRLGIEGAKSGRYFNCKIKDDESIFDAISEKHIFENKIPKCSFHLIKQKPGEYFPRMARPTNFDIDSSKSYNPESTTKKDLISIGLSQLNILTRQLSDICQTVHPNDSTFDTYGHSIRNLLILTCTEIESHWKGILCENNYQSKRKNYTTEDYIILRDAMRLNEYQVSYIKFPWLNTMSPFENWKEPETTKTLSWYAAYNAVKHDRENEFSKATLRHAFEAITACAIMMKAQFGEKFDEWKFSEAARFFSFIKYPSWPETDIYIDPFTSASDKKVGEMWHPVHHNK